MKPKPNNNLPEILGKLPPQAIDLEEAVLAAIILQKDAILMVQSIISEPLFYKEDNKLIYRAINDLYSQGDPIDLLTVTNQLKKNGDLENSGGAARLVQMMDKVSSASNIEYHARILQENWMKRESIAFGSELMKIGFEDTSDPFDIVQKGTEFTLKITSMVDNGRSVTLRDAYKDFVENIAQSIGKDINEVIGVPTGLKEVNRITGGWQAPDLIVIAARPGAGKTSFLIRTLVSAAQQGYPVGIFSLEMSVSQLVTRMVAQIFKIASVSDIKKRNITQQQLDYFIQKSNDITKLPILMDDTAGIRLSQIRAKAYTWKSQHDIKLLAVDYLQLITADEGAGNREQQVSSISRGLKKLAKELNIPVIALSQLSRAVETRGGDKKPQLSDIRESGGIEQDSDVIAFLYRPDYYGITEDEAGNDIRGLAELIFAKHRDGALDTAIMRFVGKYTDFEDIEVNQQPNQFPIDQNYGNKFPEEPKNDFIF